MNNPVRYYVHYALHDSDFNAYKCSDIDPLLARLRALAVRVRKIEWFIDEEGCAKGRAGKCTCSILQTAKDEWSYEIGIYDIDNKYTCLIFKQTNTKDAAKAACQSALEAWVGQFVEVGE